MKQLTKYEKLALQKLGESIHAGKWSNEGLVQLIELTINYLNPISLQNHADDEGISYNGAKFRNVSVTILGQKYVLDND